MLLVAANRRGERAPRPQPARGLAQEVAREVDVAVGRTRRAVSARDGGAGSAESAATYQVSRVYE